MKNLVTWPPINRTFPKTIWDIYDHKNLKSSNKVMDQETRDKLITIQQCLIQKQIETINMQQKILDLYINKQ